MLVLQGKYAGMMMFHTELIHYNEKDFKLITELLTLALLMLFFPYYKVPGTAIIRCTSVHTKTQNLS